MRVAVARALDAACRQLLDSAVDAPEPDPALFAHGRLDAERIGVLRRRAIAEVVRPCAARLLGRGRDASVAARV